MPFDPLCPKTGITLRKENNVDNRAGVGKNKNGRGCHPQPSQQKPFLWKLTSANEREETGKAGSKNEKAGRLRNRCVVISDLGRR